MRSLLVAPCVSARPLAWGERTIIEVISKSCKRRTNWVGSCLPSTCSSATIGLGRFAGLSKGALPIMGESQRTAIALSHLADEQKVPVRIFPAFGKRLR